MASSTNNMATTVYVALLFVMVTGLVVKAMTIDDVSENGDVTSILKTMQVKYLMSLRGRYNIAETIKQIISNDITWKSVIRSNEGRQ